MSMIMTNAILRCEDQVKIKGKTTDDAKSFWIGLGTDEQNQALHISSRFSDEGVIVLNSRSKGCWGTEQRMPNSLDWGTEVEILVKVGAQFFELQLSGGQTIQFERRNKMEIINWIQVSGGIKLSGFEIC